MPKKRTPIVLMLLTVLAVLTVLYAADKPPVAGIQKVGYTGQQPPSKSALIRQINTSSEMAGLPAEEKVRILADEMSKTRRPEIKTAKLKKIKKEISRTRINSGAVLKVQQ